MRRVLCLAGALVTLAVALPRAILAQNAPKISDTPHNLSARGPGAIKSSAEGEVCVFCHTPHKAAGQTPLWNRADSGATYQTYTSSTMKAAPGQPTGVSRQCLSCHDGTIALGNVASRSSPIPMVGGVGAIPAGRSSNLGTDLSSHHPISFDYRISVSRGAALVASPQVNLKSLLDPTSAVQCTSCHDPHDNTNGNFLRAPAAGSALCVACHNPSDWPQSPHATSIRTWNGAGTSPFADPKLTTVAQNACASCHASHANQTKGRLVRQPNLTTACNVCHNGSTAQKDIASELAKWSAHPVGKNPGTHDPVERADGKATHVECVDCHEPHRASAAPGTQTLPASLHGARGLSISGAALPEVTNEYEVCLRCHSDPFATTYNDRVPRVVDRTSQKDQFQGGNPSFHPVASQGRSTDVPSLIAPYATTSTIRCGSCHANDAGPGAGGAGPAGPHGSRWPYILERECDTADNTAESPQAYALCYKCHDRNTLLNNPAVGFAGHSNHVVKSKVPCSACHDSHGVIAAGGVVSGERLINFDSRLVKANAKGALSFNFAPGGHSQCSLSCHGVDHDGPTATGHY